MAEATQLPMNEPAAAPPTPSNALAAVTQRGTATATKAAASDPRPMRVSSAERGSARPIDRLIAGRIDRHEAELEGGCQATASSGRFAVRYSSSASAFWVSS